MARVEIAPSTMADMGVSLVTIGLSIIYYAAIAMIETPVGPWPWSSPMELILVAVIVGAIVATAGAVLIAIHRDRQRL